MAVDPGDRVWGRPGGKRAGVPVLPPGEGVVFGPR